MKSLILISISLFIIIPCQARTIYVDANTSDNNDGSNWANAYKYLQDALADANSSGDVNEIWVAQGTYTPDTNSSNPGGTGCRNNAFKLIKGVAIYGGFPPGGGNGFPPHTGSWEQRNPELYETILSGNIGVPNEANDNSYNIVTSLFADSNTIIDGLTICEGNANGPTSETTKGAALRAEYGKLCVRNCVFLNNQADIYGSALYLQDSNGPIINCRFLCNRGGQFVRGTGIYSDDCVDLSVINCVFGGNIADRGAGFYGQLSLLEIVNCTFYFNEAKGKGGGIYLHGSTAEVLNSILWNNICTIQQDAQISFDNSAFGVEYCCIEGGWYNPGNTNIDQAPCFVNVNGLDDMPGTKDDDPRLSSSSPCIDAGDSNAVSPDITDIDGDGNTTEPIPFDISGNPRFTDAPTTIDTGNPGTVGIVVDIGAYERNEFTIYVDEYAAGANSGSSWDDALNYLQDALEIAGAGADIRVAQGTYKPDCDSTYPNGSGDKNATFELISGVGIYGGFPSGGGTCSQRDPNIYETVLSGDLSGDDSPVEDSCELLDNHSRSDNSYHVMTGSYCDANAVIDGFTITGGNNSRHGPGSVRGGGGMYNYAGSPTVVNCKFTFNAAAFSGGGIFNEYGSEPTVTNCTFTKNCATFGGGIGTLFYGNLTVINCTFTENWAGGYGGGICCSSDSNATVEKCVFRGNSAEFGGGLFNGDESEVTNCSFSGNSARYEGGGVFNGAGDAIVTNCTFAGNTVDLAECAGLCDASGGILGGILVINCILWGNTGISGPIEDAQVYGVTAVEFSCVQNWTGDLSGELNIDDNPLFVRDPDDGGDGWGDDPCTPAIDESQNDDFGDLHLLPDSPCIDKGEIGFLPPDTMDIDGDGDTFELIPWDLDGRSRLIDGDCNDIEVNVDMGAYEFNYFYLGDFDGQCDVDFLDFAILANYWLQNETTVDIAPPPKGDGIIDRLDLALLVEHWLEGTE